jgi:F-type H+-transporting ATPase subunit gamma
MASLKIIRKRITSVRNTQQITKAMKMVAAAKLRRAQEAVVQSRSYSEKLGEVMAGLATESGLREHPLVRERTPASRVLLLLLTGDRGLCGGFNSNLIRLCQSFLGEPGREVALGTIGRKGYDFYKRRPVTIAEQFAGPGAGPAIDLARDVVARSVARFQAEEFDAVYLLYTQFRSALSQVPTLERLLPIATPEAPETAREYLYEPNRQVVIDDLLPRYVEVKVFQSVLESNASEHGARMTAMESATRNASEMIDRLTLEMNRARQATITKELMEIVGGAEALKG